MKKLRSWKKLSSKLIYKNPWIKIHEDQVIRPDGNKGIYGYLEKPTGVFIIPYSVKNNSIFLIRQNRYPIKKVIYEIPAGIVSSKNYLSEAKRELFEETGIIAKNWKFLGRFFIAPGHETTDIRTFLASGFNEHEIKSHQEGDEAIQKIVEVKVDELPKWIIEGKIECGITLASLLLFLNSNNLSL